MENSENIKNVVSSIDDETLRLKITGIMEALGINPSSMGQKFSDMTAIRNTVMNMSESDLRNIISTIPQEKAEAIMREINKK